MSQAESLIPVRLPTVRALKDYSQALYETKETKVTEKKIRNCNDISFLSELKMGTNQFQREYIEYLQGRNTELLNKLNNLKENYENKILAKDLNKHYLISALEDVLNVCTAIPQEIDFFFDKMSDAMNAFKNILLRKSEMVQLVEKISKALSPTENIGNDFIAVEDSDLMKEQISEARVGRKAGTVKVSPMINGHIISTAPRIHLSRIHGVYPSGRKSETHQLSPIIEASPDTSSDPSNPESHVFRELKIPLERINLNKMSYNYISEESPKSRFKGPKTWKKSLSSNKCQSDQLQKNSAFLESNENLSKKFSVGEVEVSHLPENIDPLEGPSWLYEEVPEMNTSCSRFMDYRRRKHRFATVFDKNEDSVNYFEKSKKSLEEDSDEFYEEKKDKDLEESRKRVSESSEDFICESFASECEESTSPKRRKRQRRRRVDNKKSNCKNDSELDENIKKTPVGFKNGKPISTPIQSESSDAEINEEHFLHQQSSRRVGSRKSNCKNDTELDENIKKTPAGFKNEKPINTPIQSESSEDENYKKPSLHQLREERKRSSKPSCKSDFREISFERIPIRTEQIPQEKSINESRKSEEKKKAPIKDVSKCDIFVKLENYQPSAKSTPKKSKSRSPIVKKKSGKSKSKSKSRSPMVSLLENEGRKRRKAAPTFKLVEPKLGTKLRRS